MMDLAALASEWLMRADQHSLAADECCPPEGSSPVEFFEYDMHKAEGEVYYRCAKELLEAIK